MGCVQVACTRVSVDLVSDWSRAVASPSGPLSQEKRLSRRRSGWRCITSFYSYLFIFFELSSLFRFTFIFLPNATTTTRAARMQAKRIFDPPPPTTPDHTRSNRRIKRFAFVYNLHTERIVCAHSNDFEKFTITNSYRRISCAHTQKLFLLLKKKMYF